MQSKNCSKKIKEAVSCQATSLETLHTFPLINTLSQSVLSAHLSPCHGPNTALNSCSPTHWIAAMQTRQLTINSQKKNKQNKQNKPPTNIQTHTTRFLPNKIPFVERKTQFSDKHQNTPAIMVRSIHHPRNPTISTHWNIPQLPYAKPGSWSGARDAGGLAGYRVENYKVLTK